MTDWRKFECEECGNVEDIDVSADDGEQICQCGGLMICHDGECPPGSKEG